MHRVQHDRERVEESLAKQWCERETRPLLIDGGISGTESVARSPLVVGVVKSHRTLYARGDALNTVLGLEERERSSVFVVASEKRERVASWYLRLHASRGHDPMWGLVRVEIAMQERDTRFARRRSFALDSRRGAAGRATRQPMGQDGLWSS